MQSWREWWKCKTVTIYLRPYHHISNQSFLVWRQSLTVLKCLWSLQVPYSDLPTWEDEIAWEKFGIKIPKCWSDFPGFSDYKFRKNRGNFSEKSGHRENIFSEIGKSGKHFFQNRKIGETFFSEIGKSVQKPEKSGKLSRKNRIIFGKSENFSEIAYMRENAWEKDKKIFCVRRHENAWVSRSMRESWQVWLKGPKTHYSDNGF